MFLVKHKRFRRFLYKSPCLTTLCPYNRAANMHFGVVDMSKKKTKKPTGNVIAVNRRARHDYFIESNFEAGLALEGWEVKSLRAGNAQLTEAYVNLKNGEAWLVGAHFAPLKTVSTHITADPTRARKLLLHRYELDRLIGAGRAQGLYPDSTGAALAQRARQTGYRAGQRQEAA